MSKSSINSISDSAIRRLILISGLIVLLVLVLPGSLLAAPPTPADVEECLECHVEETETWQNSPHANPAGDEGGPVGATCQDCHGAYIAGHPDEGVMPIIVDPALCESCHTETSIQWRGSTHAQAGVRCIGCHLSHSQGLRLSDETLCNSCHREGKFTHSTHSRADVACTDCHLSSVAAAPVSDSQLNTSNLTPSHDFTGVLPKDCLNCHGENVHKEEMDQISSVQTEATPDCPPEVKAKLQDMEQTNRSLTAMTPVSLGLGLGIGGMLGVISTLVIGYIGQGRFRNE